MKKRLFWFGLGMAALLVLAANRTAILEGLLQSDLDGGGYSGTNFLNVAATNFFGGGAGLSNVTASSVSGTLTNRVAATNVYGGGLLSQSVEDLTQATNEVTRQINSLTNKVAASNVISGGLLSPSVEDLISATNNDAMSTNETIRQINSSTNIYASLGTAISDIHLATNLIYRYSTNIVGAANFVFAKAYWTNITANFTFPALTMQDNAAMETLAVWVTNSGASTFTATINGVAGAPGHVIPAVFYCTNATVTEIDVKHFGVLWTNACVANN